MPSNYPPGVTGNEPQITGEWPTDPHSPFETVGNPDGHDYIVLDGTDPENTWWGPFPFPTAEKLARILNGTYSLREPQPDRQGVCRVCGDMHS